MANLPKVSPKTLTLSNETLQARLALESAAYALTQGSTKARRDAVLKAARTWALKDWDLRKSVKRDNR